MANNPQFTVEPKIVGIENAMRRFQDTVAKRPLKINLATDAKGLDGLNKGLGKLSGSADEFTKSLEAANARVLAFGASVAVISALQRGFINLVKSTIEVEAAFAKVAVVGDQFAATAGQLEKFGRGIFDVARQTGQSFDETSKAALEFARQGLGAAETLVRVKDALTLTRLSGLDATSAVEGLTAAVNSFKKEGLSTTDILNKLIAVDNKYAVSSGDLIEAIKRSGAFAQEAGLSFDELTATVTVLQEATARGGSVIGNSLKTILERVGRPESLKQLQDLGVGVYDAQDAILPAIKILDNFANSIKGMDESAKRASLRQLAGTLQINQLSALSNALKEVEGGSRRYDEVLATSANSSIEAATANEKLNQTLDAQLKGLLATGTQLGSLFGNVAISPALKEVTEALGGAGQFLIEGLSKDGPTFTKAFANIIGDALLAAGVAGLASIGLILKKFAIFAKDSFSNILGINSAAKNQEAIQISILNTLKTRGDLEQQLVALGGNSVAQAQLLAKAYKDAADQEARRVAISKSSATILAPGFGIGATGQPTPRGRRAAGGFVPDLIQAEYKDIKKGTGGANKNSGVVLIKDFPFGGGKKGPMVANTSEGILPMGNSAAVLNKDMLDKMGYGKRAAQGFKLPAGFSPQLKTGKFSKQSSVIESAVTDLVQLLVGYGKTALEINNALRSVVSKYDLQKKSLDTIVKAGNQYARTLEVADKNARIAAQTQLQNTKGGSGASFGAFQRKQAEFDSFNAEIEKRRAIKAAEAKNNPLALTRSITRFPGGILANPLGSYQPIRGQAQATDPLTRATQIGRERFLSSIENRPRGLSNVIGDFAVRNRTSGGSNASFGATQRLASEQTKLVESTQKINKSFNEAAIEFGTQFGTVFLGASVAKEALTLFGVEMNKTVDTIRDLTIAYIGIKKLGELGGANAGSISELFKGRGGSFGKAFSASRQGLGSSAVGLLAGNSGGARAGAVIGSAVSGLTKFGAGLLRFAPVIGQVAVGLFAVNSILKSFGVDIYSSIREFVTGLSAEGEKAKESLKTFSESLFESGKFAGKTREDIFRELSSTNQQNRASVQAKLLGINTEGKEPKEVQAELFSKQISDILGRQRTGRKREITNEQFISSGVGGVSRVQVGTGKFRDELVSELPNDVRAVLADVFSRIGSLSSEELKLFAKDKKIETSAKDSLEQLREKIVSAAFSATVGPDTFNLATGGKESLTSRLVNFAKPPATARQEQKERNGSLFADPQTIQAQVSAALELRKLQLDFSTDAERILETKIKTAQISDIERANLQANLEELKLERTLRGDIFDIASKGIDKLVNTEGFDLVKKGELTKGVEQIRSLGLGVEATKRQITELFDTLSGDLVSEQTKKEILAQLDGIKGTNNERREQLRITNEQAKLEARISESLRLQQSLLSSRSDIRGARLDLRKTSLESSISGLDARSNSPSLSIEQQNSLRREGNVLRLQSLDLDKRIAESEKKTAEDNLRLNKALSDPEKENAQKKIDLDFLKTTESINAQIEALKIQESQINASASAMTLLANAAYQFNQSLGELESSNVLATLRATDSSSLGSALSSQKAFGDLQSSGKTGLDAEQFLAERTSLRQKEFEIASATSKVQKIQLEQEKKSLEEIISIKERGGSVDEQIAAIIDAQNKRLKEQRTLRSGVNNATAQMQDEISTFGSDFGELATTGFKDSLSEALKAAASGTGDLKNALLDVALSFANKLRDAALDNLAKIATNALFNNTGEGGGGNIVTSLLSGIFGGAQKRAAGGPITGGSGNKDDVPILGMGGEFMINKQSVKKYGPQLFEALNQGRLQKMASGGLVDPSISGKSIIGAANLKKFASQNFTSGVNDKILSLGGGAASVELEPESLRLTNFARQSGNPLQSATKEAKDQALSLVFQDRQLRQNYKDQLKAIEKADKEKQKQLLVSLAVAAVGAGVGSAFNTGGASSLGSTSMTGGTPVSQRPAGLSGLSNRNVISSTSSASNTSAGITRALSSDVGISELYRPNQVGSYGLLPSLRASGGPVGGNGYGDNVPAMLSGGEFVMNRKAAKNLGLANLSAANSGQSIGLSEEKSEELNEKLISKLDELVEKMSAQNNVTVNVSMDKNGQASTSETGQQNEDQKNMNRRIKDAVVQILQEEKRLGGVLRK